MTQKILFFTLYLVASVNIVDASGLNDRQLSERLISPAWAGKVGEFVISPDGNRVAYLLPVDTNPPASAERDPEDVGPLTVVLDGKKGRVYDHISQHRQPIFSADSRRLAYIGSRDGRPYVVVDDREYEHYGEGSIRDSWIKRAHSLQFSPDSRHFAYVADSRNASGPDLVVLDGKQLTPYPSVNGIAFSPDSNRLAYVVRDKQYQYFAVVDGKEGKRYPSMVADNNIRFSPDSKRVAYMAGFGSGRDRSVVAVVDGKEGDRYLGAENDFTFSPDSKRYLYSVQHGSPGRWALVVDGKVVNSYDAKIISPAFSPDSRRIAYVVGSPGSHGERFVVIDGKEGKHYSGQRIWLHYVLFSPDSRRVAYPVRVGDEWFLVLDGKEGKRYESVNHIVFSPDGSRVVYVGGSGGKQFVVLDGAEEKHYDQVGEPVFSPDGKTLAYAAYTRKDNKWFVVINRDEGKPYERILDESVYHQASARFIRPGNPRFDSATTLRYLVEKDQGIYQVSESFSAAPN